LPLAPEDEAKTSRRARRAPPGSPELLAHAHPDSSLAEAARGIRTNILFMSPDKPHRRLLVTSPGPGEGKTTVASTIAIVMAQAGQRVLLMDCDLRRPRLHRVFGRTNDVGVTSATVDPKLLDETPLETAISNLSVLPAGPHVPNPAEFLHSEAFSTLLSRLDERYDRIVIDSPPAAIVSDATIIGTKIDGIIFIIRAQKTPRDTAKKALRSLKGVGGSMVGAVLNALEPRRLGYGKYHYYYHYGYYGRDEDQSDSEERKDRPSQAA
jgi:capsular exopolysaccharide synthesis family protein